MTASEKGVLQVPVEAVNVDSQGEFCYLIENGVLVKKYVTIGISSETYIQILDGLSKDQEIVTTAVGGIGLDEGMSVTGMPVPDMDGAGMEDVDTGSVGTENTAVGGAETEGTDAETQSATQEHTEDEADNG